MFRYTVFARRQRATDYNAAFNQANAVDNPTAGARIFRTDDGHKAVTTSTVISVRASRPPT